MNNYGQLNSEMHIYIEWTTELVKFKIMPFIMLVWLLTLLMTKLLLTVA